MSETAENRTPWHDWLWAVWIAAAVSLMGFSIAELGREGLLGWPWISSDMTDHLGAEYDNIAKAMVRGDGFADPFSRGDGPTAWMPPVLPTIIASLYWVCGGDRGWVIEIARVLQAMSAWFSLTLVLQPFATHPRRWLAGLIAALAVLIHLSYLFQMTHDHVMLMPMVTLLWWSLSRCWRVPAMPSRELAWGIGGGVLALSSPVIGATWALLTAARVGLRPALLIAGGASILVVAPWIVRNRVVMGRWMPVKSNSAYELWQAQLSDDDGIVDVQTCQTHPYNGNSEDGRAYSRDGEESLLAAKSELFWNHARVHPGEWMLRTLNRAAAATVIPVPFDRQQGSRALAVVGSYIWGIAGVAALAWILWRAPAPLAIELKLAIAIWFLVLLPYVLVSYYQRYAMPILPMQLYVILFACIGAETRASRVSDRSDTA